MEEEERIEKEDEVLEKVLGRFAPLLEGVVGMQGKVEKSERWMEASTRYPDVACEQPRNKNEYESSTRMKKRTKPAQA